MLTLAHAGHPHPETFILGLAVGVALAIAHFAWTKARASKK